MKKLTPIKQYLLGFGIIACVLLFSLFMFFHLAMRSTLNGESAAQKAAIEYADLTETTDVERYNGTESYYTVYGQTESGTEKIVAVNSDNGQIYVYTVDGGISQSDAQTAATTNGATTISKVVFGIYDTTPIWEVRADNGYYLIDFTTGELVKKEGL